MKVEDIIKKLHARLQDNKRIGAWTKGVYDYAFELLDGFDNEDELTSDELEHRLLNGADNWIQYSWAGRSGICDADIATRLCTPSELKRRKNGRLKPNKYEEWKDTQARALKQAYHIIHYMILREEL